MRSRRDLLRLAALTPLAAALTACDGGGGGSSVRIGFQKNGPLLVAKRRGGIAARLEALGARADWREFPSGPPLLEALGAGALDLGWSGDLPPIFAQAAGAPLVYVVALPLSGRAGGILVPAGSTLQSVADLKGKRVCFTRATSAHYQAAVVLEQAGLTLADVTHVNLAPGDAAAAFQGGAIDAWFIWDPFFTVALKGGARLLVEGGALAPSNAFLFAHRRFLEGQAALVRAACDGLLAEGVWARDNPAAVAALMAEETGLDPALLADTVPRADFVIAPMTAAIAANQQAIADRFLALGILPGPVTVADAVWTGWQPAAPAP